METFRFKEFEVDQRDCAMKINTDGVLLGALADGSRASRIVDVGTGTGVIALMLAQRFASATFVAIEIDDLAAKRAEQNVKFSPFSDRIQLVNSSFQNYSLNKEADLIVSNPPFYTDSLHSPDHRKKVAKHSDISFFEDFFSFCHQCLSNDGIIQIIVPVLLADQLDVLAFEKGFVCCKKVAISSFIDSVPIRYVVSFERTSINGRMMKEDKFHIYAERGIYSESYKILLKPFFLAF